MYYIPKLILSLIFISAALLKLQNIPAFTAGIHSFQLFPLATESFLAHTLPILELLCVIALYLKTYARPSALLLTLLSISFSVLYAISIYRKIDPNCGCFGSFLLVTPTQGLFRALAISTLGGLCYWIEPSPFRALVPSQSND